MSLIVGDLLSVITPVISDIEGRRCRRYTGMKTRLYIKMLRHFLHLVYLQEVLMEQSA